MPCSPFNNSKGNKDLTTEMRGSLPLTSNAPNVTPQSFQSKNTRNAGNEGFDLNADTGRKNLLSRTYTYGGFPIIKSPLLGKIIVATSACVG